MTSKTGNLPAGPFGHRMTVPALVQTVNVLGRGLRKIRLDAIALSTTGQLCIACGIRRATEIASTTLFMLWTVPLLSAMTSQSGK